MFFLFAAAPPGPPPAPPAPSVAEPIECRLDMGADGPRLALSRGGRAIVSPVAPLHSASECEVSVEAEEIPEGVLLHFTVANAGTEAARLPEFFVGGIVLPRENVQIIENWKSVHLREPQPRFTSRFLGVTRSYPMEIYSPVLGVGSQDLFVGGSIMYDVFALRLEVNLDYEYDGRSRTWGMRYRFWDERPRQVEERRYVRPPLALLGPGEAIRFTLAVTAVAPARWVEAFRPYRDSFQHQYGKVRYQRSGEPIWAATLSFIRQQSPSNPRGFSQGFRGTGRLDLEGWRGYHRYITQEVVSRGFRRIMLWQVPGTYRDHPEMNMAWEITSSWTPAMNATAHELMRLAADGVTVGLWWGRAFSISTGFDAGVRRAWNPDNPEDNELAFRELDRAYALGVRLIGLDDVWRGIESLHEWKPTSDVAFLRIFPMLYERYPEMQWVVEPAACDFLHLWGGTFLWSRDVHGPFEFADYIAPGHESYVVMALSMPPPGQQQQGAHMAQSELDRYLGWGYVPIVFDAERLGLVIDRTRIGRAGGAKR